MRLVLTAIFYYLLILAILLVGVGVYLGVLP